MLQLVGSAALKAGSSGWGAAAEAARRLAALHHAPAAPFLAHVAQVAHAHADLTTRRYLLAASAAHQPASELENVLTTR